MNGMELATEYFRTYGLPMLEEQFPEVLPYLAAGLIGSGSECLGYDDETSRDHDWEPGFCLFLPGEDVVDRRTAFLLERAYAKLPREFMGFSRILMQPVGGSRRGVLRLAEFLEDKVASPLPPSNQQWLTIPSQSLLEVTNGVVFFDNYGALTEAREALSFYPDEVRRKKLAGHLLLMAQSGQYNYMRCIEHGERAAAQLAAVEFVRHAISTCFLLAQVYEPYYKWSFRALRALPGAAQSAEQPALWRSAGQPELPQTAEQPELSQSAGQPEFSQSVEQSGSLQPAEQPAPEQSWYVQTADKLEYLLTTDNSDDMYDGKYMLIEEIAADVIDTLIDQGLTQANCGDLEKHAYSVNDGIADGALRNLHVLAAV